jgi:hypothetical protein
MTTLAASIFFLSLALISGGASELLYRRQGGLVAALPAYVEVYVPTAVFIITAISALDALALHTGLLDERMAAFIPARQIQLGCLALTAWRAVQSGASWIARWCEYTFWLVFLALTVWLGTRIQERGIDGSEAMPFQAPWFALVAVLVVLCAWGLLRNWSWRRRSLVYAVGGLTAVIVIASESSLLSPLNPSTTPSQTTVST